MNEEHPSYRGHSLFWPVVFIGAGILLLLNNFGAVSWEVWSQIWRLWPLLLVLWGLEIIFGRNWLARQIFALVILAVIIYFIIVSLSPQSSSLRHWRDQNMPWWPMMGQNS